MSEYTKTILLGILEGLTEFIPVSSTGHLIVFGEALAFDKSISASFEIFIQLGAILAVVVLYWKRFLSLIPGRHENEAGLEGYLGLKKIFLCCLPAFVLGALFHSSIKAHLFSSFTVALALIVGGVFLIFAEQGGREPSVVSLDEISLKQAFLIGVAQCFALWPGMSRSGATIVGGIFLGLERKIAAEFSFLVAVPVMCAAVAYDLLKSASAIPQEAWGIFALGFVVAFITAIFAIRFFIAVLGKYTLAGFGYYRVIVGAAILFFLM